MSSPPSRSSTPLDDDDLLLSLVTSALIATPSVVADRPPGSAPGGGGGVADRGQITFDSTLDLVGLGTVPTRNPSTTSAPFFKQEDQAPTVRDLSDASSKFSITVLSASDAKEKLLCLGIKRGGNIFCIDPKCSKAGDHGLDVPPHDLGNTGGVYIMKNSASAFCSPVVPLESTSPTVLDKLRRKKHTINDWMKKFLVMRRMDHLSTENNGPTSFDAEETKVVKATATYTPFSVGKGIKKDSSAAFLLDSFSPHRKILSGDINDVMQKVQKDPSMIPTVLREVEDSIMEAGELIQAISADQSLVKKETVNSVESLSLQLEKMQMDIGPREELGEPFQAPTLWGIIQAITGSLSSGTEPISAAELKSSFTDRLQVLEQDIKTTASFVRNLKMETAAQFQTMQAETKGGLDNLRSHLVKGLQGLISRVSTAERNIMQLGTQAGTTSSGNGSSLLQGNAGIAGSIDLVAKAQTLEAEVKNLQAILHQNQIDMQRLRSKIDTTAIKFGNLGLSSVDDCKAWIALKFGFRAYGLLFDVCLVLEWCSSQENGDVLSMLTTMEKRHKMKISTTNDARALYAMKLEFPQILYKDLPGTGKDPSFLTAMKELEDWDAPETGVRDRIIHKLGSMHSMFGEQITIVMENEPEARSLAMSMLSMSIGCCREMINYFDETMNELTTKSKFTKKKAFSLVTQVIRRFFIDLYKVRAQIYSSLSTSDAAGQCAWILYGTLRTHDVMTEYSKARFKNHPSVSSEYIRFLSTNSGFESLKTLEDKVEQLKTSAQ